MVVAMQQFRRQENDRLRASDACSGVDDSSRSTSNNDDDDDEVEEDPEGIGNKALPISQGL
jgi:hypothetical protein